MKKLRDLLVILSVFLSIVVLPLKGYALDNEVEQINLLTNDTKLKIEKFIEENMDKGKVPGLAVTLVKGDKTVYQRGFGYSDIDAKKSVTSKSLFEIGSNSKAFTALGIFNLEKSGQIKLEDEVTKYIPWLKVKYKGKEASITIEQLLHQTSGIPFKTIDKIPVSNKDNALEETVKTLINIELDSEPGKDFQYATINYDVLGLVIEKVTGKSYEGYIEENVLKPLGLHNTYLYKNEIVNEYIAKGYKLEFLKNDVYDAPVYRGNKPAGYIISSAQDMAKWLKIQLGTLNDLKFDKDIVGKSQEANRTVRPLSDGSFYASGWFIYPKSENQISHAGNNPNYSSFIVFNPKDKVGVAVLSNTNSQYVELIGQGINKILEEGTYNKNIIDLNKGADTIASVIICISILIVLSILFFTLKALKAILNKQRYLNTNGKKSLLKLVFSFLFMLGISYCIYLIPYILYRGVSWEFVFVWLPNSVEVALYFVFTSVWLVYIYLVFISFFKKENDKGIFLLSIKRY